MPTPLDSYSSILILYTVDRLPPSTDSPRALSTSSRALLYSSCWAVRGCRPISMPPSTVPTPKSRHHTKMYTPAMRCLTSSRRRQGWLSSRTASVMVRPLPRTVMASALDSGPPHSCGICELKGSPIELHTLTTGQRWKVVSATIATRPLVAGYAAGGRRSVRAPSRATAHAGCGAPRHGLATLRAATAPQRPCLT